jgi:hypothetical protein
LLSRHFMTTIEITQNYIAKITDFIAYQDNIKEQYYRKGKETLNESLNFFGFEIIHPLTLCNSSILFLIYSLSEVGSTKDKKQIQKMQLVTAYLQGIDISTNLILEGNYIKASATLKQDYEIIVRLNEVHTNRAKNGKTPNAQNGPVTYKEMYGYLNDIAHISKDGILNYVLNYDNENSKAISPLKQLNKIVANRLMTYNSAVKMEMFRQCLNLYFELIGEDKKHEQAMVYYNVIMDSYTKIGMLGHHEAQNGC